jgi:hypothetical protein
MWIKIIAPTPVLNTPDFTAVFGGTSGCAIPLNESGHPHHFEFVALEGMQFEVIEEILPHIYQIRWEEYPNARLYVDRRFCRQIPAKSDLAKQPLDACTILAHMEGRVGTPYLWGGNWAAGVPDMLRYYPPTQPLDPRIHRLWTLQGLDCSGLLFEATKGASPRNSSQLLRFGAPILAGALLKPLDMIVYPGHVLFIRDATTTIESRASVGVYIESLEKRMAEIHQQRIFTPEWYAGLDPKTHYTLRRFLD